MKSDSGGGVGLLRGDERALESHGQIEMLGLGDYLEVCREVEGEHKQDYPGFLTQTAEIGSNGMGRDPEDI